MDVNYIWASPLSLNASENIDRHMNDSEMTWIIDIRIVFNK